MWLHSTLAFNAEGTPLGLLDVQCWARDGRQFGKNHERQKRSIEEKESAKWLKSFRALAEVQRRTPGTRLVSVGDREADIYELFQEALADRKVRGCWCVPSKTGCWPRGRNTCGLAAAASGGGGARNRRAPTGRATGARGASGSALCPSHFAAAQQAEAAGADAVGSVGAGGRGPAGIKLLRWMLLTTCPVGSFEGAGEKLRWYTLRWSIEVYHRTLKSGCQIEQRQLGTAERLEACLAIDLVVGWRIFHLAKLGRETPAVPCTVYFEEAQWKALLAYIHKNPVPPAALRR